MNLRDVAAHILVNSKLSPSISDAISLVEKEIGRQYSNDHIQQWLQEVPEGVAKDLISRIGSNPDVSIQYLLKDLHAILKRSI